MIFDAPRSSWEALSSQPGNVLFAYLEKGFIPGLIGLSIGEWVIVEKLWPYIEHYILDHQSHIPIFRGSPRTPKGVQELCDPIIEQFRQKRDTVGIEIVRNAKLIVDEYMNSTRELTEQEHEEIGSAALNGIRSTYNFLLRFEGASRAVSSFVDIQAYFYFDVAEKLRELINVHARRSRYLY